MTDKRYEMLSAIATHCGNVTLKGNEFFELVPVVRCKDCVNYHNSGEAEDIGWCGVHTRLNGHIGWDIFEPNGFCSYGERRTE